MVRSSRYKQMNIQLIKANSSYRTSSPFDLEVVKTKQLLQANFIHLNHLTKQLVGNVMLQSYG